jgi:hypothetical protein
LWGGVGGANPLIGGDRHVGGGIGRKSAGVVLDLYRKH